MQSFEESIGLGENLQHVAETTLTPNDVNGSDLACPFVHILKNAEVNLAQMIQVEGALDRVLCKFNNSDGGEICFKLIKQSLVSNSCLVL